ncbi:MAG: hypothetical protein ABF983_00690 [Acetobacter indonesiensis]
MMQAVYTSADTVPHDVCGDGKCAAGVSRQHRRSGPEGLQASDPEAPENGM